MIVVSEFMDALAIETLRAALEVRYEPGLHGRPDDLAECLTNARALIVRNRTQVTSGLLSHAPTLACVGRLGVGMENIDVAACEARGIEVFPATGANARSVAEYVVTAALMLVRQAWFATPEVLAGGWPRERAGAGQELAGKRLGLVGYGTIAQETARLARGLGMEIAACDPYLAEAAPAWAEVRRLPLGALLEASDVVSLHVPLTDGTWHLIDSEPLNRMKPGSILINSARGGVVDAAALAAALKSGHLGGAALDTFETEPLDEEAAAVFAGAPNLILTPHIAGVTQQSNARVSAMVARKVLGHLQSIGTET